MPLYSGTGGALEGLYGAFGNPTSIDRQRLYEQQTGALRGAIGQADTEARRGAMGAAVSLGAGGNPFTSGRVGAQAAGDASQRVQSEGLRQQAQLTAQQTAQEIAARQRQGQFGQQIVGGLLNAGGQVLGMAVPAFGALGGSGAVGGIGNAIGGGGGNALSQGLGSAMLGGRFMGDGGRLRDPIAGTPQAAPPPQIAAGPQGLGSAGPEGMIGPNGAPETPEQRFQRLGRGGGFNPLGMLGSFGGGLFGGGQ